MLVDRSLFSLTLQLVALRIPARRCAAFKQMLSGHTLARPKLHSIIPDTTSPDHRLLLLSEDVTGASELVGLPQPLRDFIDAEGVDRLDHSVEMGYEHLTSDQVLRRLLPDDLDVPSSFEQVGHVAHLNLRKEYLPYKEVIGQVLLDKNSPRIRTIVNKVDSISNEYRVFPMEARSREMRATCVRHAREISSHAPTLLVWQVLAGDENLETTVKENGATFRLDYGRVYWNSRLEREHRRLIHLTKVTITPRSISRSIL